MLGSIRYLPLNAGEAWGYLRIFPAPGQRLAPTDIPVFEELPLDLSVVAGVITKAVQDSNSHVNLKSKERGTPNMVLRDAGPANARLAPSADQPVHFVVRADDFVLEPTTEEEVARRFAARLDRPLQRAHHRPTRRRSCRSTSWRRAPRPPTLAASGRFGAKAANLAFLGPPTRSSVELGQPGSASAAAGYDLVPHGFAVPLAFYTQPHRPPAERRAAHAPCRR